MLYSPGIGQWTYQHVKVFGHIGLSLYILCFYFLSKQGEIDLPARKFLLLLAVLQGFAAIIHALDVLVSMEWFSPLISVSTGISLFVVSIVMVRRRVPAAWLMLLTNSVLMLRLIANAIDYLGLAAPHLAPGQLADWMSGPELSLAGLAINLTLLAAWIARFGVQRNRARAALQRWQAQEQERLTLEVERQTMALHQALQYAESANRKKTEGLGYISHDLRAPLSAILSDAKMLSSSLDEEQKRYTRSIMESVHYQLALIDNLLEYSRNEFESFALRPSATAFPDLMDATCHFALALSTRQHNQFRYVALSALPDAIMLDGRRLQQVLLNLLVNAAKFTQRGLIKLEVCAEQGEQGWQLRFSVSDSGIGMSADAQARVFNAYTQVHPQHGGVGLGLYIARQIVEAMGGSLELESAPGAGSRFSFQIVAASANVHEVSPQPAFDLPAAKIDWPELDAERKPDYPMPPPHARVELVILARDGQLTKIEEWLARTMADYPEYPEFFDEVKEALHSLDFEYIEALALAHDASASVLEQASAGDQARPESMSENLAATQLRRDEKAA